MTSTKDTVQNTQEKERQQVLTQAQAAQNIARKQHLTTEQKNVLLDAAASALESSAEYIIAENARDLKEGKRRGFSESLLDRLTLDQTRIAGIAQGLRKVIALPDPVGDVVRGSTLPNGLLLEEVRVPLGVMAVVYEARPNVTVDAFSLAIKSGNVPLLRGSKSAVHSNSALVQVLQKVCVDHGLAPETVQLLPCETHESVQDLITARGLVDVVIPRGSARLIDAVTLNATVPTIETGTGNCHFYIHASADVDQAIELLLNGKTRRPSVCNTTETALLDAGLSSADQLRVLKALQEAGVAIHANPQEMSILGWEDYIPAQSQDWEEEYLSLDIAVKIVDDIDQAIEHIDTYSTGHTEAMSAQDYSAIMQFQREIDAAAIIINSSTAWTDGEMFGFGAEIGISTQKLHARGPMGLPELTTTKWLVMGEGQVRP